MKQVKWRASWWMASCLCTGVAVAGEQVVTPFPMVHQASDGQSVAVTVLYSSRNPADMSLLGLGLRLHWDSSQLRFEGLNGVLDNGLVGRSGARPDNGNFDGDEATDAFVLVAWADNTGDWPGEGVSSVPLFTAEFTAQPRFSGSALRFSTSSTAPGFALSTTVALVENQGSSSNQWIIFDDGYEGGNE